MNNLLINTVFSVISLISICCGLEYRFPKILCDKMDFSAISIGKPMANYSNLPEIMLIAAGSLWYWPHPRSYIERHWLSALLPIDYTNGFVSFKRNFYRDNSECSQQISSSFVVIYYDSKNNSNLYNIYEPSGNGKWTESDNDNTWPLLKNHYLFQKSSIDFTQPLSHAFSTNQSIIVFQNTTYFSILLNQKECDFSTDLKTSFKHFGPNTDTNSQFISSFVYNNSLHVFKNVNQKYTYMVCPDVDISDTGILKYKECGQPEVDMLGSFFKCENPGSQRVTFGTPEPETLRRFALDMDTSDTTTDAVTTQTTQTTDTTDTTDITDTTTIGTTTALTETSTDADSTQLTTLATNPDPIPTVIDKTDRIPMTETSPTQAYDSSNSNTLIYLVIVSIISVIIGSFIFYISCVYTKSRSKSGSTEKIEAMESADSSGTKPVVPISEPTSDKAETNEEIKVNLSEGEDKGLEKEVSPKESEDKILKTELSPKESEDKIEEKDSTKDKESDKQVTALEDISIEPKDNETEASTPKEKLSSPKTEDNILPSTQDTTPTNSETPKESSNPELK